ncbi:endonuclease/exonuclease/phosphatase family protein [Buchananella hordeovulneris]|uniref:endonuclease/exonuclease/phosphatase family protein n=1 Tax=Buchananella hordeovulneris TaxID=52770 RepID=UPI000F601A71|nr:endonuclease/exonuclease/phosphatase family protein [Buchananella hordeovulneris]RRD44864.1 endonuclease/exonuclease/phosphatase family protein [Buchananella hordeovulneris]
MRPGLLAVLGLLTAALLGVGCCPQWAPLAWLTTRFAVAHALAFGQVSALALGGLAVLWGLLWWLLGRGSATGSRRSRWGAAGPLVVACASLLLFAAWLGPRAAPLPPVGEGGQLRVATWNAYNSFGPAAARALLLQGQADVVVLPEQDGDPQLLSDLVDVGLPSTDFAVFTSPPTGTTISPTTIIVRRPSYVPVPVAQTTFGTVHLRATDPALPDIIGLHTAPPLPGLMGRWRTDLALVQQLARAQRPTVLAGDFNASLLHGPLRALPHTSALSALPAWQRGTWPTSSPRWLRTGIDHVFVPPGWAVSSAQVIDIPGSDHAALITTLGRR